MLILQLDATILEQKLTSQYGGQVQIHSTAPGRVCCGWNLSEDRLMDLDGPEFDSQACNSSHNPPLSGWIICDSFKTKYFVLNFLRYELEYLLLLFIESADG